MKKIFLFAVAAMVSLSSCVQTEEVYTGGMQELVFKSAVTRGIIQSQVDFKYPIAVTAVWDDPEDGSDKYKLRFDEAKFVYDNDLTSWRGETPYYWPNGGNVDFLGFCPYPNSAVYTSNINATTGRIENIVISSISNNIKDQHDILYSDLLTVAAPKTDPQPMTFHHALTQVNLEFLKSESAAMVVLNSVRLEQVPFVGTLTITPHDGAESDAEWSGINAYENRFFLKGPAATGIEDFELAATLTHDTPYSPMPLLIIPMDHQTSMVITYTVNGHKETKTVDLSAYGTWEMGKKYTYKFNVNINEILFDCTVNDWDPVDVNSGSQIVI